ncbi:hypothetical protein ABR737_03790 [Streptomyces sp. Edi2]|uniref:hypothetical protein n=1 Tax=Streptomyces sp. Edi2 TaxID=3162528 RepID=UPI00330641BA
MLFSSLVLQQPRPGGMHRAGNRPFPEASSEPAWLLRPVGLLPITRKSFERMDGGRVRAFIEA